MNNKKNFAQEYLRFDRSTINDEMEKQAESIHLHRVRARNLKQTLDNLEEELEEVRAKIGAQERVKYKSIKALMTEAHIKDLVTKNPEVVEFKKKISEAKYKYKMAELRVLALKDKSEMMVNRSHNMREEIKTAKQRKV